jgi:hypothetical protein
MLCPVVGAVLENAHATFLRAQRIVLMPWLTIRQSLCILPVNLVCVIHSSPRGKNKSLRSTDEYYRSDVD